MKTTFAFLTWLILLAIIKRLIPDWFNDTKPQEEEKAIKAQNSPVIASEEKTAIATKPNEIKSSPIELERQNYNYRNDDTLRKSKKQKKQNKKREFFTEDIPDNFYSLSKLTITPVFAVANLKNPANSILEFSVKGFNIYGQEIPTGEIMALVSPD